MLHKTKAIVLHYLKYGDTSLVTTTYTESFGRKTFLVQGAFSKKSKFHSNFFQPFTLLNLETYIYPKRELQRIKEINLDTPFQTIPFDPVKNAIALFLSEILYKTLKEEEPNSSLFDYIYHSIQMMDAKRTGTANFHLLFLINLTRYLGFYPEDNYSEEKCLFDPVNGKFFSRATAAPGSDRLLSEGIHKLLNTSFDEMESLAMNHQTRNALVNFIVHYYNIHLGGLSNLKSLSVLKSIFE